MSLMNEIEITSGSVRVNGSIAYASQESWSFNSTILENVVFGKPYDSEKFRQVIAVCAMRRDLKLFPFAEKTLVGERGVSLSGGQKARMTLARYESCIQFLLNELSFFNLKYLNIKITSFSALYNDSDIYLLDDPLSAVDSEVAKHIFEKYFSFLKNNLL